MLSHSKNVSMQKLQYELLLIIWAETEYKTCAKIHITLNPTETLPQTPYRFTFGISMNPDCIQSPVYKNAIWDQRWTLWYMSPNFHQSMDDECKDNVKCDVAVMRWCPDMLFMSDTYWVWRNIPLISQICYIVAWLSQCTGTEMYRHYRDHKNQSYWLMGGVL